MNVAWKDWHAINDTDLDKECPIAVGAEIVSRGGAFWRVWKHKDGRWFVTIGHGGDITETVVHDRDHGILFCEHHIYRVTLKNVLQGVVEATSGGDFCDNVEHGWLCECDEQREHIERMIGEYVCWK